MLDAINTAGGGEAEGDARPGPQRHPRSPTDQRRGGTFAVAALNGSKAAADLGIDGDRHRRRRSPAGRLLAGLDSVLRLVAQRRARASRWARSPSPTAPGTGGRSTSPGPGASPDILDADQQRGRRRAGQRLAQRSPATASSSPTRAAGRATWSIGDVDSTTAAAPRHRRHVRRQHADRHRRPTSTASTSRRTPPSATTTAARASTSGRFTDHRLATAPVRPIDLSAGTFTKRRRRASRRSTPRPSA